MNALASTGTRLGCVAAAAIAKFLLMTIDANGQFALCGATDIPVAQSMDDVDSGEIQGGRLAADGVWELTASKAIAILAPLYTAANGKVTDTMADGARLVGFALRAAGADGDVIPVLPAPAAAGVTVQDLSATTYAAPNAGALNSGDAGTDTVIASVRTQLIALAADVAAIRADMVASGLFKT